MNDAKLTDIWYSNDYDMYIWGWGIEPDPNFQLSVFQENQCGVWSDTCYSNPEYDQLFKDQQAAATVEEREQIVDEMQQVFYDDRPEIVLWLNNSLAAYRNEWTGSRSRSPKGNPGASSSSSTASTPSSRSSPPPAQVPAAPAREEAASPRSSGSRSPPSC